MNGLKFSQEAMSKDPSCPVESEDIDVLLDRLDVEGDISDGALEQVYRFLEKIGGTSQDVNHELLQRIFKCLQVWALSPAIDKLLNVGIVRLLATMFDNFIQSDYNRPDILASILELLFVVEDMSDGSEGKIQCGKFFLFRLLALATSSSKLPSVRLQRAAIETTCALVTRSPENQLAVLDQKVQCYRLFKEFLPRCGDFQLQASITEMFYRLAKRGPQLLDLVRDEAVRKSIESLLQSKKPNLLSEIRTIVTRLNESLGHARSVYSFPVERILINGHNITTTDMWVNFGRAQLSFFVTGLPDTDVDEPSVIDLQYEDLVYHKRSSSTLLEILLRPDTPDLFAFKAASLGESSPSTGVQAQFFFLAADLSNIEANVFPKIRSFLEGKQGKRTSKSEYIDKSTSKGTKIGPSHLNIVHATNTNSHPTRLHQTSPAGDGLLSERRESRGLDEKSSHECMHAPPDVSQTPRDLETLEGVTTQDYTRSKRNMILGGFTSDGLMSCKPPGRQAQGCYQAVAAVPSTFERFNRHVASGQRRQEDSRLQNSNTEPFNEHQNMSMRLPIDVQADVQHFPSAAIAANDTNKYIQRTSKLSHLKTQNLQEPSGPKTKSPADINHRALEIDDETIDEADDRSGDGEIRMKKLQDSQPTNVVPLESPLPDNAQNRLVGNNSRQVNNAELQEAQRFSRSSEKNRVTLRIDIVGSDSVMTDLRETHVTSGKDTKSCRKKSSRAAPNAATGQVENEAKSVSRTLSKRKCKKTTSYFDADDDLTAASDSYPEFIATRWKKPRGMNKDPINKSSKHKSNTQTIPRCARLASVPVESKALMVCERNGPTPNKQTCRQKTSTMATTQKQRCSKDRLQASHAGKVPCASSSRKDLVQDVFCFTTNPSEKQQFRKTSPVSCKAKRNSDHAQPNRKRRKNPASESHMLSIPRQRSCISEGRRTVSRVRPLVQILKSPPRASPARSASTKQDDEVTPEQTGAKNGGTSPSSRSSDSEENSRSPLLRTQKTYTKSDKIITKASRLERWKSFSIRKLEFCSVDATSRDDFSDDTTPENSPHPKAFEVEDAAPNSEDSSGICMITQMLKRFKQKVMLVEKKKVEDIVSNTIQHIDQEIYSAKELVRVEKTEFLDSCTKKCGQLHGQLQEQIKKIRAVYDKFKQDFAQEGERHDIILGEIEATELKLNELAKQQGQKHKEILAKLKESCKNHLTDADQKILDVLKGSTGMHCLKDVMQGLLKDL